ncbi:MAG: bifunctional protein-serine/threonine kinase/phosphatase [Gammaproteobacteria bacterium]|nr:bifunctional protein-serine/threonine kinase/phosphatase [Gammaproteobacteria bacterium]
MSSVADPLPSAAPLRAGFASQVGARADNQDYVGIAQAGLAQQALRGSVFAVADGMSGGKGGRVAAELTVRGFIEGYFGLPDTFTVERATALSLSAINTWISAQGRQDAQLRDMASTLTALLVRGRVGYMVHAGDSRLYRLRAGTLELLSTDHVMRVGFGKIVTRAVGLEKALIADLQVIELLAYDRYLLCTDGVSSALSQSIIQACLTQHGDAQAAAAALVADAIAKRGADNASAIVVDIMSLPPLQCGAVEKFLGGLPIVELPQLGEWVDGFRLDRSLHQGRYSRLFEAYDPVEKRPVAIKFPHPRIRSDANVYSGFIREAWVASQVSSPWIAQVYLLPPGRQTRLYSVAPFYRGETLEVRLLRAQVSVNQGIDIGLKLAEALDALHRKGIVHRDVKPANVMLLAAGGLKLLDLGLAYVAGMPDAPSESTPGTLSYMAPELANGHPGDARSDVYACGITLFRLFSGGHFPYGLRHRTALSKYRPDLPPWLDGILEKASATDPKQRYNDAIELANELEHARLHGGWTVPASRSLYEKNPLALWQAISALLALALLCLVWWAAHLD